MFIFWILAAVAALFFIKWLVEHEKSDRPVDGISSESALDILKKRYARGEIDREQYESMKQDLQD